MLVADVRNYHLEKLDREYAALRKLAADPRFTNACGEDCQRTLKAVLDRCRTLAELNAAAQPAVNAQAKAPAKPATAHESVLDQILAAPSN